MIKGGHRANPTFIERKIKFNDWWFKYLLVLAAFLLFGALFWGPAHNQDLLHYWVPFLIAAWGANRLHQQNEKLKEESGMTGIPGPADLGNAGTRPTA